MESRPQVGALRIVLVDDDPDARLLLTAILEAQFGAHVVAVADVAEAARAALQVRPDLVVSDGLLAGEDAADLAVRLGSDARTAGLPIVVVTASQDATFTAKLRAAGVRAVLAKPPECDDLEDAVVAVLSSRA